MTPSKTIARWMQQLGKLGGLARAAKLTKSQRLASSQQANAAKRAKQKGGNG